MTLFTVSNHETNKTPDIATIPSETARTHSSVALPCCCRLAAAAAGCAIVLLLICAAPFEVIAQLRWTHKDAEPVRDYAGFAAASAFGS
jgi:hypothetical protein